MSLIDVEKALAPISAENPCGENLEYDVDYAAMELAAAGKPEQQFGATVIPGEEPDWRAVRAMALGLFDRTKDLRVAMHLARSAARVDGIAGAAGSLAVLAGLVDRYWESVHPQLDPDDGNDPTARITTIASLCDPLTMVRFVREAPLVQARGLGSYCYRDVMVAQGELPPPAGQTKTEMSSIDAAFAECEPEGLRATAAAAREGLAQLQALERKVTELVGVSQAPALDDLASLLKSISRVLQDKLAIRGLLHDETQDGAPAEADVAATKSNGDAESASSNGRKAAAPAGLSGEINSREDVIRAIDKICDYYRRYEPSSPVPLFLNRAKRLASKSFLEILRDLTPEAVTQALAIGGISDGADPGGGD